MSELQQTTVIPPWTLGWRLQRALDWANVSTQEMADELEVSRGTISRWCHDQGMPKRVFLKHWALRCGVPYEWLAEGIGEVYSGLPNQPAGMTGQPEPAPEPGYAEVRSPYDDLRKRLPLTPRSGGTPAMSRLLDGASPTRHQTADPRRNLSALLPAPLVALLAVAA